MAPLRVLVVEDQPLLLADRVAEGLREQHSHAATLGRSIWMVAAPR